ncbi:glutathione Stransferase [Seminavis robusta]|uniref:Glutathione Stransferase n=1 Tax=Seminavis robusta TaxID=568900 RepID=A0A9N8HHI8_9STRA|nr:glutathione Stransferase [Seminavis robusta]|eukprot:Sro639_g179710.1 glutathione Stransferase (511) ;mRNA; f:17190-18722
MGPLKAFFWNCILVGIVAVTWVCRPCLVLGFSSSASSQDNPYGSGRIPVPVEQQWLLLEEQLVPPTNPPLVIDSSSDGWTEQLLDPTLPTLARERNGWCLYSTRLWLALEVKCIPYQTILVEYHQDTYDGSYDQDAYHRLPSFLHEQQLPLLSLPPNPTEWLSGGTEDSSWELLQKIEDAFPDCRPMIPPDNNTADSSMQDATAKAYQTALPTGARSSPRAGWLFSKVEGYRLDALPRESFERFLDIAEETIRGPLFAGPSLSLADIVWAPLLERYHVQLPSLHQDLFLLLGSTNESQSRRWPKVQRWYQAMMTVPAYACRVKGDAVSWHKVLSREPWWPSPDLWHPRDTVGPKGELYLTSEECSQLDEEQQQQQQQQSTTLWKAYSEARHHMSPKGPAGQAALLILQNRAAILEDAKRWMEEEGYNDEHLKNNDLDAGLCAIVTRLSNMDNAGGGDDETLTQFECEEESTTVPIMIILLQYLDSRVCVPRDMGALSAAALRRLKATFVG